LRSLHKFRSSQEAWPRLFLPRYNEPLCAPSVGERHAENDLAARSNVRKPGLFYASRGRIPTQRLSFIFVTMETSMPQFMTIHRTPGLKPEDLAQNTPAVLAAKFATFRHFYVNLADGFIVSIFEAESRALVEEQLEVLGFPIDEMHEIHFAKSREELAQMARQQAAT
jgi:hypothetical protein